jgi:hypothetical protein
MIALLLAIGYCWMGIMYVTPGLLPVASVPAVKWARIVVGFGMVVLGIGEASLWWNDIVGPSLLQLGLAIFGSGMVITLLTIVRQPCAPKV